MSNPTARRTGPPPAGFTPHGTPEEVALLIEVWRATGVEMDNVSLADSVAARNVTIRRALAKARAEQSALRAIPDDFLEAGMDIATAAALTAARGRRKQVLIKYQRRREEAQALLQATLARIQDEEDAELAGTPPLEHALIAPAEHIAPQLLVEILTRYSHPSDQRAAMHAIQRIVCREALRQRASITPLWSVSLLSPPDRASVEEAVMRMRRARTDPNEAKAQALARSELVARAFELSHQ